MLKIFKFCIENNKNDHSEKIENRLKKDKKDFIKDRTGLIQTLDSETIVSFFETCLVLEFPFDFLNRFLSLLSYIFLSVLVTVMIMSVLDNSTIWDIYEPIFIICFLGLAY